MILLIDNYDSFTYNIASYVEILKYKTLVIKNDKISLNEISDLKPKKIILSPGPGDPNSAGITLNVIKKFHSSIPILGVCLGHQAIGQAFGGKVIHSGNLIHGQAVGITHDKSLLFKDIPSPFNAVRYNSLTVEHQSLPKCLSATAWSNNIKTDSHDLMAIEHKNFPTYGVQFHPESYGSEFGTQLIKNFCVL